MAKALVLAAVLLGVQQAPTTYSTAMCSVQQPHASLGYIRFCMREAPENMPSCRTSGDPRESMWAAQSGPAGNKQIAYYEVLDCSWHYGKNPRDAKVAK